MFNELILPLRTFQIRMLNSGEQDVERSILSKTDGSRMSTALLDRLQEPAESSAAYGLPTGKDFVGLFINTNRRPIRKDFEDRGYVIAWENRRHQSSDGFARLARKI